MTDLSVNPLSPPAGQAAAAPDSIVAPTAAPQPTQPRTTMPVAGAEPGEGHAARRILRRLADELKVAEWQVERTVELLDGGATVPFIARYRKEATGGLDDGQLRELDGRLASLRELEKRRVSVVESVRAQGKLSAELAQAFAAAESLQALEDLYLPYKPKRITKAMMARAAGLEALADALLTDPGQEPLAHAAGYVAAAQAADVKDGLGKPADFSTAQACLDGARDILAERWSEDAVLLGELRAWLWDEGWIVSRRAPQAEASAGGAAPATGKVDEQKFRDYFDHAEPIARVPSHRALALFRGRSLGVLTVQLCSPDDELLLQRQNDAEAPANNRASARIPVAGATASSLAHGRIARHIGWVDRQRPADGWIARTIGWTWRVKLALSLERELFARLREAAEQVAIKVFGDNLRDLLLAPPAGGSVVMGLDPGLRTGVKVAVVGATGALAATATIYPHEPRRDWEGALHTLAQLVSAHGVELIAIGNGTASRETDQLARELVEQRLGPESGVRTLVVSEAGASVYSASELAAAELPQLDVSLRGAVSIARRVQDPLAELVKIDPKSIGVGQYQHDVDQARLARQLDAVVEDCVNSVGVDLNTASPALLARVAGLSAASARALVRQREHIGRYTRREQLLEVPGIGPKTFEQAAGFLRIRGGDEPLDASAVHPESYALVERLLQRIGAPLAEVLGRPERLAGLDAERLARELGDAQHGVYTVRDLLAELAKPGRDPRGDFRVARFNDGVHDIADLKPGMIVQGTVSNVAAFGAFVDLGVHQDGLIHVSQLAERFVKDAREVVKTGDAVRVRVLDVDVPRRRIALSLRLQERGGGGQPAPAGGAHAAGKTDGGKVRRGAAQQPAAASSHASAMALAFARLGEQRAAQSSVGAKPPRKGGR
jgi:uncharacterized protein